MTVGEIYSVIWAKTRDSRAAESEAANEEMYQLLQKIKGRDHVS
jgi:hypothetical protein